MDLVLIWAAGLFPAAIALVLLWVGFDDSE
jgi:hypothetical protein